MKTFLDANILVAVINKEYPLFTHAARLLSLQDKRYFQFFTSPVCLAIAFYFAEKKVGTTSARKKLAILSEHLQIAGCGKKEVLKAAQNPKVNDFEDGLEYYSALHAGCSCIITENTSDFYFSDIEVLPVAAFLKKYAL